MVLPQKTASAPGKVLLTGGYLVLDRDYTGLVFGLDARIHVHVKPLSTSSGVTLSEIIVKSPQFVAATWDYGYRLAECDGGFEVTQLRAYISTLVGPHIEPAVTTILADNDYYSQLHPEARSESKFIDFGVPLWEAHKTGLGSSAALVTAFTAALLVHYLPLDLFALNTDVGKRRLHNLAQAAHCAAQGKVGSGFDVASAVYGSCRYRRFSPSVLQSLVEPGSSHFSTQLKCIVEEEGDGHKWDMEISKSAVRVPKGIRLVMCDVSCGSQTPGMVKKVLAWRQAKQDEASDIWETLQGRNEELAVELVRLAETGDKTYQGLRKSIENVRALIREMSELSGVPIEPASQTKLLDACSEVPGVIGGVVPGAGGFDAVALLVEDKEEVVQELQRLLDEWQVSGLAGDAGRVRMLGVREEMEGVRTEDATMYGSWVE
ncbi:hypothetical protein LTR04_000675 [Oleoguttula sp. CCFEE 6159]|nr:hypothetical protein LTR04_000675 [Oleoguttula sp. CCFEE 6159]